MFRHINSFIYLNVGICIDVGDVHGIPNFFRQGRIKDAH